MHSSGSSSQIDFLKEQLEVKNREKTEEATSLQKEIDLSHVLFILTANDISSIPSKIIDEDRPLKYRWKHVSNGQTITSIYNHLNNIPNINKEEWIPIE